jgi:hypothetical protein
LSVRAAAKQRRLRAKGGVSAFAPTPYLLACVFSKLVGAVGERLGMGLPISSHVYSLNSWELLENA